MVLVRHPLTRLAHVYQSKVVDQDFAGWREKITKLKQANKSSKVPSFADFVDSLDRLEVTKENVKAFTPSVFPAWTLST